MDRRAISLRQLSFFHLIRLIASACRRSSCVLLLQKQKPIKMIIS